MSSALISSRSSVASRLVSAGALVAVCVLGALGSLAACGGSTTSGVNDGDAGGLGSGTGNGNGSGNGSGSGSGTGSSGGSSDASSGGADGAFDGGRVTHVPAVHRATAVACSHDRGPGTADPQIMGAQCSTDAECTAGADGRCLVTTVAAHLNYCSYDTCFTDADCGGKVCTCRESPSDANTCEAGNCKLDSDCGAGGYCSPSADPDKTNFGTTGWWCHTATDACTDDTDCDSSKHEKCVYDPTLTHWTCSSQAFLPP